LRQTRALKGDPFENLFKKKVNADTVLEGMEVHYRFSLRFDFIEITCDFDNLAEH
jgi:hypothetical protein